MDWMDFNRGGEVDGFETYVGLQMMAGSRQEAIALTEMMPSIPEVILWKRMKTR